jgi:hypothetical protein
MNPSANQIGNHYEARLIAPIFDVAPLYIEALGSQSK